MVTKLLKTKTLILIVVFFSFEQTR